METKFKNVRPVVTANPSRQPFRIRGGWCVDHNELRELDPSQMDPGDELWCFLIEDLAQFRESNHDVVLDVGWCPDSRPEGKFRVVLIRNKNWEHPLRKYETRSLPDLVRVVEEWLALPPIHLLRNHCTD
jgi:hypothetical protein